MVDLWSWYDGEFNAFAFDVHQESSECETWEGGSQFIVGHLHMLGMQLDLVGSVDFGVKFTESPAVSVVNKDDFSE